MNFGYISDEAWAAFEREHHRAAMFLLHESLVGELRHLRSIQHSNFFSSWQAKRLKELELIGHYGSADVSIVERCGENQ